MSVLIKGMRMPENCIKCPMHFGGWCYVAPPEIDERVAPTVDDAVEQGKPDWCPLVDLGKHGRLIDADEVVGGLAKAIPYFIDDAVTTAYVEGMQRAKIEIDDAPTVIEAEDGT